MKTGKYYEAYDERYKVIHGLGHTWSSEEPTPIVMETIEKYGIGKSAPMLEIGCGEGRDAIPLLARGFDLLATDISAEAIYHCRKKAASYADRFHVMNCLDGGDEKRYRFIYSVAVVHMLLRDFDRGAFFRFIYDHLDDGAPALICSMGDGKTEYKTDEDEAFELRERDHASGKVMVAATSCRMVTFEHFEKEISDAGLRIEEKGITSSPPDFDKLMYAVVRRDR